LTTEFGPILNHVVGQEQSQARAAAESALGGFIPFLSLTCPAWLHENVATLLDGGAEDPVSRPAWGQYLIRAQLYDTVFEKLRPWYVTAAATPSSPEAQERRRHSLSEKLAEHVTVALLR
jgi:hypothetical protein